MPDRAPILPYDTATNEILGTAVHAIHSFALMIRQTKLDQQQRQYIDRILVAVGTLQHTLGDTAQQSGNLANADQEQTQTSRAKGCPQRLLLVEDDEINQAIVCEILKGTSHIVDVAGSGEEALSAVSNEDYNLIFMDIKMPGMGGLEATKRIRANGYTMPIVGLTGDSDAGAAEVALEIGMTDYLTKPVSPEKLSAVLDKWLCLPAQTAPAAVSQEKSDLLPDSIAGFNMAAGLAAVGNNKKLYAELLERFALRYTSVTEEIAMCLQRKDIETAVRLAHTVKGVATNLGATRLAESAGELEKIITANPKKITVHLERLMLRLDEAIGAVHDALKKQAPTCSKDGLVDLKTIVTEGDVLAINTDLESAISAMEQDWNNADLVAQNVYSILLGSQLEHSALLLKQAVEDFAPQKAYTLCLQLQDALRASYNLPQSSMA